MMRHRYLFASFAAFFAVFGLFGLCPMGLRAFCENGPTTPYYYMAGTAPEKDKVPESITFLQWNICFLPYDLATQYGGVEPAKKRVGNVAQFIIDADADIVALQEAHDLEAIEALAQSLQNHYAHIYYNIGHVDFSISETIDEESPFLNSGLMVLSKYPLADVHFKAFTYPGMQWQINKGYFDFYVRLQERDLIYAVVTHLQPYDQTKDEVIREKELMEIVDRIENNFVHAADSIPYVVMGDINIPWGTSEYHASAIRKYFRDDYAKDIDFVTINNRTATDFFTDFRNADVNEALQHGAEIGDELTRSGKNPYAIILDYFLLYKDTNRHLVTTQLWEAFVTAPGASEEEILNSLSDHHALKSSVTLD